MLLRFVKVNPSTVLFSVATTVSSLQHQLLITERKLLSIDYFVLFHEIRGIRTILLLSIIYRDWGLKSGFILRLKQI